MHVYKITGLYDRHGDGIETEKVLIGYFANADDGIKVDLKKGGIDSSPVTLEENKRLYSHMYTSEEVRIFESFREYDDIEIEKARKSALSKLTDEERKLLNLK